MLNIEKYKDEIINYIENGDDLQDGLCSIYYNSNHHSANYQDVLNWLCEEYQEPILDEEEKAYLSAVIKPFRDRVVAIAKHSWRTNTDDNEYIKIRFNESVGSLIFPCFEKGTMYKNMRKDVEYSLKNLDL